MPIVILIWELQPATAKQPETKQSHRTRSGFLNPPFFAM